MCSLDSTTQKYMCQCFANYQGSSCQTDLRPCSIHPCLNNATCLEYFQNGTNSFKCNCQQNYYGVYCENEVNMCANRTCSGHGFCTLNNNLPSCKCFIGYTGTECELENEYIKFVRGVQWTSIILCICFIGFTVLTVISNDIWTIFIIKEANLKIKITE